MYPLLFQRIILPGDTLIKSYHIFVKLQQFLSQLYFTIDRVLAHKQLRWLKLLYRSQCDSLMLASTNSRAFNSRDFCLAHWSKVHYKLSIKVPRKPRDIRISSTIKFQLLVCAGYDSVNSVSLTDTTQMKDQRQNHIRTRKSIQFFQRRVYSK